MRGRIFRGDASAVGGVPVLVVPANRQLTLGWGSHLAEKVLALAGPEVEKEALAARPGGVALGEVVLTSAGRMAGFTHLVHAAVLDKYDWNPLFLLKLRDRTSEATLRAATAASLAAVEKKDLPGLVFTPMGAGIGGMSAERCARIMVEEARRFFTARPRSPIRDVVFACLREKEAKAFAAALAAGGPLPRDPDLSQDGRFRIERLTDKDSGSYFEQDLRWEWRIVDVATGGVIASLYESHYERSDQKESSGPRAMRFSPDGTHVVVEEHDGDGRRIGLPPPG